MYTCTNRIIEIIDITDPAATEPVTYEEAVNYMRLSGFEPVDTNPELPLFDQALIGSLISAARDKFEKWTGLTLIDHVWKAAIYNSCQSEPIELPFSSGGTITELLDIDGDEILPAGYVKKGLNSVSLVSPYGNMTVTYTGVGKCPPGMKLAILAEVAFRYENRGELTDQGNLSTKAQALAAPFKNVDTWLA